MAELILNSNWPPKGSDGKSYYDFSPGNNAMLEAIEARLAGNPGYPALREQQLAALCELSSNKIRGIKKSASQRNYSKLFRSVYRRLRARFGKNGKRGLPVGIGQNLPEHY